jgi:hypothetical protein
MTARGLSDILQQRFGASIATAVLSALAIDNDDCPIDLSIVERSTAMALDAELLVAGSHFVMQLPMSALANSPGFLRAASAAGVSVERLDALQRLRIDAGFTRRWRAIGGARLPRHDSERAQATMASVLLEELQ